MKFLLDTPACKICGMPVCLETCKIDEHGRAVHEDCYVEKLLLAVRMFPGSVWTPEFEFSFEQI